MPKLGSHLNLSRCPHCGVDTPALHHLAAAETKTFDNHNPRTWVMYGCSRCGGAILAAAAKGTTEVCEMYPTSIEVHEDIPSRARAYLQQALDSLNAPAGSVILAASSVDAMLKAKGLNEGSLYKRIEEAAVQQLITNEMARWAHDVRLDANDQRHGDDEAPLPSIEDARRAIDFVQALAMFLFVLPARVTRGLGNDK